MGQTMRIAVLTIALMAPGYAGATGEGHRFVIKKKGLFGRRIGVNGRQHFGNYEVDGRLFGRSAFAHISNRNGDTRVTAVRGGFQVERLKRQPGGANPLRSTERFVGKSAIQRALDAANAHLVETE
jgi:hypothetical protein